MLKIRQATTDDAESLTALAQRCVDWQRQNSSGAPDYVPHYQPPDFSQFYIALAEDPQCVGFYQLDFIAKDETAIPLLLVEPGQLDTHYPLALFKHAKIQAKLFGAKRLLVMSHLLAETLLNTEEGNKHSMQRVSGGANTQLVVEL